MEQERTYKWIQERLRDLRSGTLSEDDRLHLEEIAKTDPFIRDALDGYQAHADQDHSALLHVLSQRIQNKSRDKRTKLMPLSRGWVIPAVAASFVLILATWAVFYYLEKQGQNSYVAAATLNRDSMEHTTEVQLFNVDTLKEGIAASEEKAGSKEQGAGRNEQMAATSKQNPGLAKGSNQETAEKNKDSIDKEISWKDLGGRKGDGKDMRTSTTIIRVNDTKEPVVSQPVSTQPAAVSQAEKEIIPVDQNTDFLVYLKTNSVYPVSDTLSLTAHEVTVGFRVSATGRPDVIRMVKSLADPKYMAEAIRLIQKGPDWSCDGGVYPCEREFTIYFK